MDIYNRLIEESKKSGKNLPKKVNPFVKNIMRATLVFTNLLNKQNEKNKN